MRILGIIAIAAPLALLAGCNKENQKLTIGNDLALETFAPEFQNASTEPIGDKALSHKLTDLQNMGWKQVDFPVPNAPVAHRPVFRTEYAYLNQTPRQQRLSPTPDSALQLGEETLPYQLTEAFVLMPGIAIWDFIKMPFVMVGYPGFKHVKNSPTGTYERKPLHDTLPPGLSIPAGTAKEKLDACACEGTPSGQPCACKPSEKK